MTDPVLLLATAPDGEVARSIARVLVEERHAACCNVVDGIRSIYRWEGKVEEAGETLMLIKSDRSCYDLLAQRFRELHPYDVPELIVLPIEGGLEEYLRWMGESTGG